MVRVLRFLFLITPLFYFTPFRFSHPLYADAYLAEDRIYYGADSYTLDYDREIIRGTGNAFFRKEDKVVYADRIEIYYSVDRKVAFFYENVIFQKEIDDVRITGDFGEARFKEDLYIIEGNAMFSDRYRKISTQRIEAEEGERYRFSRDVKYWDNVYDINAPLLKIDADKAVFDSGTKVHHIESGDTLYSDTVSYFFENGDVSFQGGAQYLQGVDEGVDPLIIESEVIRYYKAEDLFVLLGGVLLMSKDYELRADLARFFRDRGVLTAIGDIVLYSNGNYIYCDTLEYDRRTNNVLFFNSIRGIFTTEEQSGWNEP